MKEIEKKRGNKFNNIRENERIANFRKHIPQNKALIEKGKNGIDNIRKIVSNQRKRKQRVVTQVEK